MMRSLEEAFDSAASISRRGGGLGSAAAGGSSAGPAVYGWLFECHGFWHNVLLVASSLAFALYLAAQARKSFSKLSSGRSSIMIAYYGCLWLVSLLNLTWCSLQKCEGNFERLDFKHEVWISGCGGKRQKNYSG